jgi:hypothetical protein
MDQHIVLAIIALIIIAIIVYFVKRAQTRESLSDQEICGITGAVTLPYFPLGRYDYYEGKDCTNFARMGTATGMPTGAARADYLARKCDEMAGCVAFNMDGALLSGILPWQTWTTGSGLYARKCAMREPLYVEIFEGPNFDYTRGRTLLPLGDYADMNALASYTSIIVEGNLIGCNKMSSIRVPVGLRAIVYDKTSFTGKSIVLTAGAYPDLRQIARSGNLLFWDNAIKSMRVQYDSCANIASVAGGATTRT